MPALPRSISRAISVPLLLGGLFLFLFTFFSANKHTGSDPKLTLLVSQAILEHGTVRLDAYAGQQIIDFPFADYVERTGLIIERDGRYYAYFPVGPSVLALPFVAAYRALGKDMRTFDSFELQIGLAALSVTAVFFLLYLTGTHLVRRRAALAISFVAVAGSALSSTLGTALWSLNFSAFFISLILWLLVRDSEGGRPFNPILLGLLLFLTYFSRPSTAAFIAPVFGYLLWQRRAALPAVALSALLPLLAFLGWSRWETGQWLPDYYSAGRFGLERPPVWVGVLGNLLSPSRGLFWFSPFLLLIPAGIVAFRRQLARRPLFWLCLAWFGLQLLLVSSAVIWWGGYSYGPRLLADALPGLALLLFLIWREATAMWPARRQQRVARLFALLGVAAIAIQAAGLYRGATSRWNEVAFAPPTAVSSPLGDFFDPRYAQFLAGSEMVCALEQQKVAAALARLDALRPLAPGEVVPWDGGAEPLPLEAALLGGSPPPAPPRPAVYAGWQDPAAVTGDGRLNDCAAAAIFFELAEAPEAGLLLHLRGTPLGGDQPLRLSLNGVQVAETVWPQGAAEVALPLPAAALQTGLNTLLFEFPEARPFPPRFDYYRLRLDDAPHAVALREWWLAPP